MRTSPFGRTWIRNRRRNSSVETVITLLLAAVGVVLPAEGDAIFLAGDEAMVGDGDAVCVASQVVKDMLGSAEGRLGVDDPLVRVELVQEPAEALGLGKILKGTVELQLAVDNELLESSDEGLPATRSG